MVLFQVVAILDWIEVMALFRTIVKAVVTR